MKKGLTATLAGAALCVCSLTARPGHAAPVTSYAGTMVHASYHDTYRWRHEDYPRYLRYHHPCRHWRGHTYRDERFRRCHHDGHRWSDDHDGHRWSDEQ